jgi:DNA-binding transcriptional MerR regulator
MDENYSIEDLEKHSGLSTRTLHYYMSKGLLPGPETRGKYASYTQEHLDRLDLILILKDMHLPLDEIKTILNQLTPDEIRHYRDVQEDRLDLIKSLKPGSQARQKPARQNSALAYLISLEEGQTVHESIAEKPSELFRNNSQKFFQKKVIQQEESLPPSQRQEVWRRFVLEEGIELHVRETSNQESRYQIERLLSFSRSLFKNEKESK